MTLFRRVVVLVVAVIGLCLSAKADTLYVNIQAEPGGDGRSWNTAYRHLNDALTASRQGDELWVAKGTYKPDQGTDRTAGDKNATFRILNRRQVYGGFKGTETLRETRDWYRNRTILSGDLLGNDAEVIDVSDVTRFDNSMNVVTMTSGDLDSMTIVDGLVITAGFNPLGEGAGILVGADSPIFRNCEFLRNGASKGGAAYVTGTGQAKFEYCTFIENMALREGGAICYEGRKDSLTRPAVSQSHFIGNRAGSRGGAISFVDAGTPRVASSVFYGNRVEGIGGAGGAIHADERTIPYVVNTTFVRNLYGDSSGVGAAVAMHGAGVLNSIFWGTEEENQRQIAQLDTTGLDTMIAARACLVRNDFDFGFWQNDPMFIDIEHPAGPDGFLGTDDDGLRVDAMSTAHDAGVIDGFVNHWRTDCIGNPRLVERKIDLGAYEWQRPGHERYREIVREMREDGLVYMYRHMTTDWDQKDPGPAPECFPGRNLSYEGRQQGITIGKHSRALGIDVTEVLASPVCRCWETAFLIYGTYEKVAYWGSGGGASNDAGRRADLSRLVLPAGTSRAIATHDAVILTLIDFTSAEVMEGDAVIIRPLGDTFEVIGHFCSDTWERYHVRFPDSTSTGVDGDVDVVAGNGIHDVHPNPVQSELAFSLSMGGMVQVIDVNGGIVLTQRMTQGRQSLSVSSLTAGVYALRVVSERGVSTAMFVKR